MSGLLLCITIIGIPFGFQAFKMGLLALFPFGQTSVPSEQGTGCLCVLMNILWFFLGGIWIALTHLCFGLLLCYLGRTGRLAVECKQSCRGCVQPGGGYHAD